MEIFTDILLYLAFGIYEIYAHVLMFIAKCSPDSTKKTIDSGLRRAFQKTVDGPEESSSIQVLKPDKFYPRVAAYGDLGIAEGYLNGEWTTTDLFGCLAKAMESRKMKNVNPVHWIMEKLNLQTRKRAWEVADVHYNIGNDLFEAMLDKHMQYTCAYWRNASNLEEAQIAKMDLIARKLHLKPGMRVLDIGCGYGTLICYLAKNYGVSAVGCTISKEQVKYGQSVSKDLPVEIKLCDYRDMDEKFDRVVSAEVLLHVGPKNYREFMQVAHRCLTDDGIFLLHCVGINHTTVPSTSLIFQKYVLPNVHIPYYLEIANAIEGLWIIEDWHNFRGDYNPTIEGWEQNFERAWPNLQPKYGDQFYRMWKLYLSMFRASFFTRSYQLWQIVLSKDGLRGGYKSER